MGHLSGITRICARRYARTVELAANHSVDVVTPWIALGCGNEQTFHLQSFSFDYGEPRASS